MRLLVESELSELLMSVSLLLLLLPPVELESELELELESSDNTPIGNTPTSGSTPVGNSDPSTALTGLPSVSGGLFLSSVMVVPDKSLFESSDLFFFLSLSLSSKSSDVIASIFSIISMLESLPPSDRSAIFLATGAGTAPCTN
jgi:hypothetical protein